MGSACSTAGEWTEQWTYTDGGGDGSHDDGGGKSV